MAALIDAIGVKRKMFVELDNMLTRAVFDKTFKASDKFKEPDLQTVEASYLYSDADGSYFLDQETFETLNLSQQMIGDALDLLLEGTIIRVDKYNGNPIGLQLPAQVELAVTYTEPGVRGDTASGSVTKPARLETGIEVRVPFFIKEGEKIKVDTETRQFSGRA
jgi:elongation factor P